MSPDELKALEKRSKRLKRIASEWASKMHDLVEDRLPAGYGEIPELAQATHAACEEWAHCMEELKQAREATLASTTSNAGDAAVGQS